ncbi:MAG: hypothetical protein M0Z98_11105 [Actinomycetales bacterium]|nr:hypothetical protein [Actinomycetales bacterium]
MIPLDRVPPPTSASAPVPTGSSTPRPGETLDRTVVIDSRVSSSA